MMNGDDFTSMIIGLILIGGVGGWIIISGIIWIVRNLPISFGA